MKILKTFLIFFLFAFIANAEQRFTDKEREQFMKETRVDAQVFKSQNGGKFDLQLMKPFILQGLEENNLHKKFSKAEMIYIKSELERYMKDPANNSNEERFFKVLDKALAEISKKSLEKIKAGGICNEFQCEANLACAIDPLQATGGSCLPGARECREDADCCSDSCVESAKNGGKKTCASIKRCYLPVKIGESCLENPACEKGECLPFDSNTIGINECKKQNNKCTQNSDCCSNLCSGSVCKENSICKSCAIQGDKASNGRECCEGLYKNEIDMCVPDMPPIVPPALNVFINNNVKKIFNLFIETAQAGEAYNTVKADKDKYSNFEVPVATKDTFDIKDKSAGLGFTLKSDFEKCDMHFREDFYAHLIKNKLFDQEVALLAFDYVASGESNNDYWRKTKEDESTSVNSRLKVIANSHLEQRAATNTKIADIDRKLTCMCIDAIGVDKLNNPEKTNFFNSKCEDYRQTYAQDQVAASCNNLTKDEASYNASCGPNKTGNMSESDCANLKKDLDTKKANCANNSSESVASSNVSGGDASSIKSKRMLTYFTTQLTQFNQSLTVDNSKIYLEISNLNTWMNNDATRKMVEQNSEKIYDLGDFTLDGMGDSARAMGAAFVGALLAASVIAVLGGFASSSILSGWVAASIISATALSVGGGVWMMASLKGAWFAKRPVIADEFLRTQSCGKKGKHTCSDWKRKLTQPYNTVCDAHINSYACVKNFVVVKYNDEFRYILDPFIPVGVSKEAILKGQSDYVTNLENGFRKALEKMRSKALHDKVSDDYMWNEFIDETIVGNYAPDLGANPEEKYLLNESNIQEIKDKAKKFAIDQKFLVSTDTENLNKFADYSYQYHFMWSKTSMKDAIMYPLKSFGTYLEFMSNGVAASLTAGSSNAATSFAGLNSKYLNEYLKTLKLYRQQANNISAGNAIDEEIAKVQQQLAQNKLVSEMIKLEDGSGAIGISGGANAGGINGSAGAASGSSLSGADSLTSLQKDFLQAISNYKKLRNAQLKKASAYKNAISRGEISKERASQVGKSMANYSSAFTSPLTASLGRGFNTSGTMNDGSSDASKNASSDDQYGLESAKKNFNNNYGDFGTRSQPGIMGYKNTSGKNNGQSGATEDDSKKLTDAANAVNKENYKTSEENSLFERITKAYFRNYDKVLTKKKVIEKQAEKKD